MEISNKVKSTTLGRLMARLCGSILFVLLELPLLGPRVGITNGSVNIIFIEVLTICKIQELKSFNRDQNGFNLLAYTKSGLLVFELIVRRMDP